MAKRSAHLVDDVMSDVPARHWVLSLSHRLRYLLAWDHLLCARAGQRDGLERLCRYALRPPLAQERLHRTSDGEIWLTLRHRTRVAPSHPRRVRISGPS